MVLLRMLSGLLCVLAHTTIPFPFVAEEHSMVLYTTVWSAVLRPWTLASQSLPTPALSSARPSPPLRAPRWKLLVPSLFPRHLRLLIRSPCSNLDVIKSCLPCSRLANNFPSRLEYSPSAGLCVPGPPAASVASLPPLRARTAS